MELADGLMELTEVKLLQVAIILSDTGSVIIIPLYLQLTHVCAWRERETCSAASRYHRVKKCVLMLFVLMLDPKLGQLNNVPSGMITPSLCLPSIECIMYG